MCQSSIREISVKCRSGISDIVSVSGVWNLTKCWLIWWLLLHILFLHVVEAKSNNSEPSGNNSNHGGTGGSSGKGPKKDWWSEWTENQQQIWIAVACAAAAGLLLFSSGNQMREINWQEFRTGFLEKGEVLDICSILHTVTNLSSCWCNVQEEVPKSRLSGHMYLKWWLGTYCMMCQSSYHRRFLKYVQ